MKCDPIELTIAPLQRQPAKARTRTASRYVAVVRPPPGGLTLKPVALHLVPRGNVRSASTSGLLSSRGECLLFPKDGVIGRAACG